MLSELEAWLEKNPDYEALPRDYDSDDDEPEEEEKKGNIPRQTLKNLLFVLNLIKWHNIFFVMSFSDR